MSDTDAIFDFCKEEFNLVDGTRSSQKISLFTLSTCMWCKKTKKYLNDHGIKYKYIDVDKIDMNMKSEIITCLKNGYEKRVAFPFLIIDGEPIVGYHPEEYEKILKKEEGV
jgi:glutaredoxin-like protein NrdH